MSIVVILIVTLLKRTPKKLCETANPDICVTVKFLGRDLCPLKRESTYQVRHEISGSLDR